MASSYSQPTNLPVRGWPQHLPSPPVPLESLNIPSQSERPDIDLELPTFDLATNFVVGKIRTFGKLPDAMGLLIERGKQVPLDWDKLKWTPFQETVPIQLDTGEGDWTIWIGGRWGNFRRGSSSHVRVDHTPPVMVITNPITWLTSQPTIQLQGYANERVQELRYDLSNSLGKVENVDGLILDGLRFQCDDIDLAPGTNTIVLRCEDLAGNKATNTLNFVFSLEGDKTPPVILVESPANGEGIEDNEVTIRGRSDDPTATISVIAINADATNSFHGLVERDGYFWVEHIPLTGVTRFELTATDAAGNVSRTNFQVYRSADTITIDPVNPQLLFQKYVTVAGTVSPANRNVWVNGAQAQVDNKGIWIAERVPIISPNSGRTVIFEATTVPRAGSSGNHLASGAKPRQLLSVVADLSSGSDGLNSGQPACGAFNLHLTGVAGRRFVIQSTTNLISWTSIATNSSTKDTFDFFDPETAKHPCRFFRVLPLP